LCVSDIFAKQTTDIFPEQEHFCTEINLFDAGVNNTIVHFRKAPPTSDHQPTRVRRWGEHREEFEHNVELLPTASQLALQDGVFREHAGRSDGAAAAGVPLGMICYISKGMVIHADERKAQGTFRAEDLVQEKRDARHPKPFIEGKDIVRWVVRRIRYLEWGTERAPARFSRQTFPELHEAPERLLALRICGDTPTVTFDDRQVYCNHTAIVFVPWHLLRGVRNRSIRKSAKYSDESKPLESQTGCLREDLENLSSEYHVKYLLAVMNSSWACQFLRNVRRTQTDIYPDDWKQLPIPTGTPEEQEEIAALVDEILALYAKHGHPLPAGADEQLRELEREIDERVAALYGL